MTHKQTFATLINNVVSEKHPKCLGTYDEWNGDYDCEYDTIITCDECKYGVGKKDPEAKVNRNE